MRLLRLRGACRATRPASGPTRPTTVLLVGSGPTRATPQTPRACRATRPGPAARLVRPRSCRLGPDVVRLLRLLGRVARRVRPAARLVRPRSCRLGPDSCDSSDSSGVSHDASRQRPDSSDHQSRRLGPDSCDSSDFSVCRTTRPRVGPTPQTRDRVALRLARLVRLVRLLDVFPAALVHRCHCARTVSTAYVRHVGRLRSGSFQSVTGMAATRASARRCRCRVAPQYG